MKKTFFLMALSMILLAGCSDSPAEEKTAETLSETVTETVTEENTSESTAAPEESSGNTASEAAEESESETTADELISEADDEELMEEELIEEEIIEEVETEPIDIWRSEVVQDSLFAECDPSNFERTAYFERGGASLSVYTENTEKLPMSLVVYCKSDNTVEVLYAEKSMFTACGYDKEVFADYQNFDYTAYAITTLTIGNCLPIKTWHLMADGSVIDLADTIDFETTHKELYIGGFGDEEYYKTVIGLREQIPGTTTIGSSQLEPVTMDENEKIVKLDIDPII